MKLNGWMIALPLALGLAGLAACGDQPLGLIGGGGTADDDGSGYTEGTVGGEDDGDDDPTNNTSELSGLFSGGEENTFSHYDDLSEGGGKDPFEILAQRQEEGPPEIRTRLHSCRKPQLRALRGILEGFGVNIDASGNPAPAGQLFREGRDALGGANYGSRTPETVTWTNSGATKMLDIFVMAAPEIIANISTVPHCQIDGVGPQMFDANDRCNEDAVTCLIGRPATEDHLAVCDAAVRAGTDIERGKTVAVAALLSAAHTCE